MMETQAAYDAFWQMVEMLEEQGVSITPEISDVLRIVATQVAELEVAVSTLFAQLNSLNRSDL